MGGTVLHLNKGLCKLGTVETIMALSSTMVLVQIVRFAVRLQNITVLLSIAAVTSHCRRKPSRVWFII